MAIKDMGESIVKMLVNFESVEISEEAKVELSEKKTEMEKKRINELMNFRRRKELSRKCLKRRKSW